MTRPPRRTLLRRSGGLAICLAAASLTFCSCRTSPFGPIPLPGEQRETVRRPPPTIVRDLPDVEKTPAVPIEPIVDQGPPVPMTNLTPWSPPGIAGPWPHDEFLEDGGDRDVQVNVGSEGELRGLELEDTVAVYDTIDGRTCIEPSNRVCLYAPRFAAVRKVTNVVQTEQSDQLKAAARDVGPMLNRENLLATTAVQPVQPVGNISRKQPSIERAREREAPAATREGVADVVTPLAMHEDLRVLRQGVFEESEKARLIEMVDAAIVWSHDKGVQVVLEGTAAVSVAGEQKAQETFRVDVPNHPCLRVIKTASTKTARPGEIVEFTIRFDNMGDQAIEHVTLVDNLTTRLEYVPGTAQSSREAEFTTEVNEGDSLELRWDFRDPLPFGQGGLVHFQCRVR